MEGFKPKQIKALGLLATGTSITDTAKGIGINQSVIYDWFELAPFEAGYNLFLDQMKRDTEAGLLSLSKKAVKALEKCLNFDNHQIAFKAALRVMEKVQYKRVGDLDPRDIVSKDCTYPVYDQSGYKTDDDLDLEQYEEACKELGIDPYQDDL
ncbi:MAG: hypothetical protein QNL04_08160 [SAR324 cluster bacterium]|nr:hypothetical protein [SAR324 cluster bacterium]